MRSSNLSCLFSLPASRLASPFLRWSLLLVFLAIASSATAQSAPGSPPAIVPRVDLSAGFDYIRANAPPSGCQCFTAYGGYASAGFYLTNWISVVGQVTGGHGNNISNLGQGLTLFTYTGGPRVTIPGRRIAPYAEALFGEGRATNSYFPTANGGSETAASSFAIIAGGGIDYKLTSHFAVRASGEYLRTAFPNGSSGAQNHLLIGAGIVYRIGQKNGERKERPLPPIEPQPLPPAPAPEPAPAPAPPPPPPPPPPPQTVTLTCTTATATINPGDTLELLGKAVTNPDSLPVTYSWTTGVGKLIGSGAQVLVDTFGVPPGSYHVIGHVVAEGTQPLTADCDVPFRIQTIQEAIQAPTTLPSGTIDPAKEKEFHDNVPDALFDYDKATIRPDTQRAINHAAEYLAAHPEIRVLLGGYADNRGSMEYNLILGEKRARAVRAAMIAAGVAPERLEIVTYGKFVQVCTANTEQCRQRNRRVAFAMHP